MVILNEMLESFEKIAASNQQNLLTLEQLHSVFSCQSLSLLSAAYYFSNLFWYLYHASCDSSVSF